MPPANPGPRPDPGHSPADKIALLAVASAAAASALGSVTLTPNQDPTKPDPAIQAWINSYGAVLNVLYPWHLTNLPGLGDPNTVVPPPVVPPVVPPAPPTGNPATAGS